MREISKSELQQILNDHKDWLNNNNTGKCANLRYADLSSANLRYADLRYANLRYADLSSANLSYANLSYANLSSANLSSADLRYADLRYANLRYANLSYANLSSANLSYANLSSADLITFQYQQDQAFFTGRYLRIGCENHLIEYWIENYQIIGKNNSYNEMQIFMYGQFIESCYQLKMGES